MPAHSGGTPFYEPPEYDMQRRLSRGMPGDIWAFGVTILHGLGRIQLPDARGNPNHPRPPLANSRSPDGHTVESPADLLELRSTRAASKMLSIGEKLEATPMLQNREWLDRVCRDVLDECDEILHPRQQLIYPSGRQSLIDGSPDLRRTTEAVLELTQESLPLLSDLHQHGINVVQRTNGAFPYIHVIRKEAEDSLIETLAKRICSHESDILPVHRLGSDQLGMIQNYLLNQECRHAVIETIEPLPESIYKTVLLLVALLAFRILPLALSKRWDVEYGLRPARCPVSVP